MGFLRYDDDELNARLVRSIVNRWPQEHPLVVVHCEVERLPEPGTGGTDDPGQGRVLEPGVLAVTERRVVFLRKTRGSPVVRISAALFLVMAGFALVNGRLGTSAVLAAIGGALWVAGKVAEDASIDQGQAPLTELDIDMERQELRPFSRWTRIRRLLVPDPSAFGAVIRLIHLPPATSLGA